MRLRFWTPPEVDGKPFASKPCRDRYLYKIARFPSPHCGARRTRGKYGRWSL